jgi:uncharacterized Zn finger protein
MGWYDYKPYVPVAERRARAAREVARRLKKGETVLPVQIDGRTIAETFWGKAWCTNLESYSDYANRLPRGRTYVRNGSVVHLKIDKGRIDALVSGSELYEVRIDIAPLPRAQWEALKKQCAGQIGSLVELLQGKLSKGVMERVTNREQGLFPKPKEITMRCSCPDYAGMCKHLAAVLYGVGNRLDSSPESLFLLRGVDHTELIEQALPASTPASKAKRGTPTIAADDLGDIFGIEVEVDAEAPTAAKATPAAKAANRKKPAARAAKPTAAKATSTADRKKPAAKPKPAAAKSTRTANREKPAAKPKAATQKAAANKTAAARSTKKAPARKKG